MWRRLLQVAVVVSLLLCLAVHVLWLRSHFFSETIDWKNTGGWRSVQTAAGHLQMSLLLVDWSGQPANQFSGPKYERSEPQRPFNHLALCCHSFCDERIDWEYGGFAWHAILDSKQGHHDLIFIAPCWALAAMTAALPLAAATVQVWRRGRRQEPGVSGQGTVAEAGLDRVN